MNNHKLNIDDFTRELIRKGDFAQPGKDFTRNVMSQIIKDPAVKVNFVTNDDSKSNFWLIFTMFILIVGFIIYYIEKFGLNFSEISTGISSSGVFNIFSDLFSKLLGEISLSPYILVAFIGIVFLVIIDKTIVKYLYSI